MVQPARTNAAVVLSDFANASVSAELLANAKTLNAVLLAHRALETRFEVFSVVGGGTASTDAECDLRLAALASPHGKRITALAARPSGLTVFVAPLAPIDTRVASLEATSTDLLLDDDDDVETTLVFADRPLPAGVLFGYLNNAKIAGQVKSADFQYLEPVPKDELNKLEFLR